MPITILIESMTKIIAIRQDKEFVIRCWRQETNFNKFTKNETERKIKEVLDKFEGEWSYKPIAEHLLYVVRMNAVEVLDSSGQGCVLYANWP